VGKVGEKEGSHVDRYVGLILGEVITFLVGAREGFFTGRRVGAGMGSWEGSQEGGKEGSAVGIYVGSMVGEKDGFAFFVERMVGFRLGSLLGVTYTGFLEGV